MKGTLINKYLLTHMDNGERNKNDILILQLKPFFLRKWSQADLWMGREINHCGHFVLLGLRRKEFRLIFF